MTDKNPSPTKLSSAKQALLEIRKLRAKVDEQAARQRVPVAIIGCGVRLPGGVKTPEQYWGLLESGTDAISEIPPDRWDVDAFYNADRNHEGTMYTRAGGFLDSVDQFDAQFFGISPREAASMDPQHRVLLEVCWEALEHAGKSNAELHGSRTGVFVGMCSSDYSRLVFSDPSSPDVSAATGNESSVAAGRLSYILGIHGPSMVVDTACSSSLVALHLAVNSLRRKECDLAIVAGVNTILSPDLHINFCKTQMLSADGRSKTFDAAADGYGRGEGCAVVIIKRSDDARRDNDRVIAQIRGTAVNQDGQSAGLTAPNGVAQEMVIRAAADDAGCALSDITYVEAHGTGTPLGDPIEARALGSTIGSSREPDRPLLIGSVKTNLGHLEAAAGLAGVIKVALSLQRRCIPAHLNYRTTNPEIPLQELNLEVVDRQRPWPSGAGLIAGVSSFGFSGTNAHAILEAEAERDSAIPLFRGPQVLAVSARSEPALRESMERYRDFLSATKSPLQDISYTSTAGRTHMEHRLALVCDSPGEAARQLESVMRGADSNDAYSGHVADGDEAPRVVFMFAGQGAQYRNMGKGLYERFHVYREALDRVAGLIDARLGADPLLEVMHSADPQDKRLDQTLYTQPATFALAYATHELWCSFGVRAEVVLGHSLGEYMAALAAGILSLEDAAMLVAERARLSDGLPGDGAMAVVFAAQSTVRDLLTGNAGEIDIAAVNSPDNTVISGARNDVSAILGVLEQQGIEARTLNIGHAFHSRKLDSILESFEGLFDEVEFGEAKLALLSNVTGDFLEPGQAAHAAYWRDQLRQPVQFRRSIERLRGEPDTVILEIGPHPALLPMVEGQLDSQSTMIASLWRDADDVRSVLNALARLHVRGVPVDWRATYRSTASPTAPCIVTVPTYPFRPERHWIDREAGLLPDSDAATAWRHAVDAAAAAANTAPLNLDVGELESNWHALRMLTCGFVVNALHGLGLFNDPDSTETVESLRQKAGIETTYEHLVTRWLRLLDEEGFLTCQFRDGELHYSGRLEPLDLGEAIADVRRRFASELFVADYVQRCGGLLPKVVTGEVPALETLFPGGSSEIAEKLYTEFSVSRYISNIASSSIAAIAASHTRTIQVLEIGAGTGGTTAAILPSVPPGRARYCFTDISDYFLNEAAQRFSAYDYLDYRILNIGDDPESQGFPPQSFDVVVATNVLHATPDLRKTLANVLGLLKSNGVLVLSEVTRELDWFDISTGLIEGWQSFDDDLRADSPLLPADVWVTTLREAGFQDVMAFPEHGSPAEATGQNVIVALAPRRDDETATGVARTATNHYRQAADAEDAAGILAQLKEAPPGERHEILIDHVINLICAILRLAETDVPDRDAGLFDLGLDSLMALDFRRRLAASLALQEELPATLIFDYPNAAAIVRYLEGCIDAAAGSDASDSPDDGRNMAAVAAVNAEDLQDLTDEDVEAMLLERLNKTTANRSS